MRNQLTAIKHTQSFISGPKTKEIKKKITIQVHGKCAISSEKMQITYLVRIRLALCVFQSTQGWHCVYSSLHSEHLHHVLSQPKKSKILNSSDKMYVMEIKVYNMSRHGDDHR
jgi:hypothetical protein